MSIAGNQQRTLLALLAQLRPHWHRDRNLPARIQSLIAAHRAFGSRDRRLYRELIYTTLRYLPWIEPSLDANPDLAVRLIAWLAADSPATEKFRATLIADWPSCPAPTVEKSAFVARQLSSPPLPPPLPDWFREHAPAAFAPEQVDALLARAPLWLRLQTDDPTRVTAEFDQLRWRWHVSPVLPTALQLLDEVNVTTSAAYQNGLVEIQDLASQLVLESAAITPGEHWLDACAGAGGKTLQLARLLGPTGHVDAHDIRPAALAELATRATRAHIENLTILRTTPTAEYDGVFIDAPCSGSGTWRRAPHLKWTTTPAQIEEAATLQLDLLSRFSARVRPGGRLIYATCSLSRHENEIIVAAFLQSHPNFIPTPPARTFDSAPSALGLTFLPATHNSDALFVSTLTTKV